MAKSTGRQLRSIGLLFNKYPPNRESAEQAQMVYQQLPEAAREGLQLGAARAVGQSAGGNLASLIITLAFGRMAARSAVIVLGPRGTLHAPHWSRMAMIFGGVALSYLSLLGATVNFFQQQQQIYQQFPGTQQTVERAMDEVLKGEGSDKSSSKKD